MSWGDLAFAGAAAVLLLFVPGLALGLVAGLRGLWLWAGAPVFAVTAITIAGVVSPLIGVRWSLWSVVIAVAMLGLVVAGLRAILRWRRGGEQDAPARSRWIWIAAPVVAAIVIVAQCVLSIGRPDAVSQTFDNVFHLNAIRYVLDTGTSSPFVVGLMSSPAQWFYPAGWHAIAALLVQLTGVSIPVAANATWITFAAVVWPVGAVLLARVFGGSASAVAIGAAAGATAVPAFPLLMSTYGVLYPYGAGLAALPFALAVTTAALRLGRVRTGLSVTGDVVVLLGALPALALTHPGAFMAWLALSVPLVVVALARRIRRAGWRGSVWPVVAFAAYLVAGVVAVRVLRPPLEATLWPPTGTLGQAIGEVLVASPDRAPVPFVVAAFLIVGLIALGRRHRAPDLALIGLFATAGALYVVVAGVSSATLRNWITAAWYNNTPRLAALLVIPIVVVAAVGVAAAWEWLLARPRVARLGRAATATIATVAAVLLLAGSQTGAIWSGITKAQASYNMADGAWLLSDDEVALLEELDDLVPEGALIAGNPWTGTGLAYAFADRQVLMPHILAYVDPAGGVINQELATGDPSVCDALAEHDVRYILDFGDREVHGGHHEGYEGVENLEESDAVQLVREIGDARLYEVTICR
ncbi:hypothetical protein FLP10_03240 [Agromyces intestinalis]|uniref:Uncharacterized protein n=1 Tax=Agromyces intestinalis TaxID=2592652 RepID=A0A5C1YEU1_9MICO|nr:DUF6541 family protein [Agromyces intestinalis]QEO13539.1 hypothetical protein FLP10_03240 [Agromyces intestinalis]